MEFSIKNLFSNLTKSAISLRIWSDLPKKSLMEHFFLCSVKFIFQHASCCLILPVSNGAEVLGKKFLLTPVKSNLLYSSRACHANG